MKTKAVRLYGKDDLRLEEFELPPMQGDEILAEMISDSLCMSSYKAAKQGARFVEVPVSVHSRQEGRSKISGTRRGTVLAAWYRLGVTVRYAWS